MEGYDRNTYGESFAEVYDDWYGEITDTQACVAAVSRLAGEAAGTRRPVVLELGVGTGRLAVPLAEAGIDVRGIDSSAAMVERLRARSDMPVIEGDFAELAMPPAADGSQPLADLVLCAYNTFFNLAGSEDQRRCMSGVAEILTPGGLFVLEAFVPPETQAGEPDDLVRVRHLSTDCVVLSASVHDPAAQTISGQYVEMRAEGNTLRPWHIHYLTVEQCDDMAAEAGMTLIQRWSDWNATPFGSDSQRHISVYAPR